MAIFVVDNWGKDLQPSQLIKSKNMKTKESSVRSPKSKFRCEINLNNALAGIGSVISFNSNTIDGVMDGIAQKHGTIQRAKGASLVVLENKKTYPEFDWQIIRRISIPNE